jgi:hypothetical protein
MSGISALDLKRIVCSADHLLTCAGACDFGDGATFASLILDQPEEFLTWSRKKTSSRKVACSVVAIAKSLLQLETALKEVTGFKPMPDDPSHKSAPAPVQAEPILIKTVPSKSAKVKLAIGYTPAIPADKLSVKQIGQHLLQTTFAETWNAPETQYLRLFIWLLTRGFMVALPRAIVWSGLLGALTLALLILLDPATAAAILWWLASRLPYFLGGTLTNLVVALGSHIRVNVLQTSHCHDVTVEPGLPSGQPSLQPHGLPSSDWTGPGLFAVALALLRPGLGGARHLPAAPTA